MQATGGTNGRRSRPRLHRASRFCFNQAATASSRPTDEDMTGAPYRATLRCIRGCAGEHSLLTAIYRCPACNDLLEVAHDLDVLRTRSAGSWMRLFDERYKRTTWPYGSAVWGKKEWVCPDCRTKTASSRWTRGARTSSGRNASGGSSVSASSG